MNENRAQTNVPKGVALAANLAFVLVTLGGGSASAGCGRCVGVSPAHEAPVARRRVRPLSSWVLPAYDDEGDDDESVPRELRNLVDNSSRATPLVQQVLELGTLGSKRRICSFVCMDRQNAAVEANCVTDATDTLQSAHPLKKTFVGKDGFMKVRAEVRLPAAYSFVTPEGTLSAASARNDVALVKFDSPLCEDKTPAKVCSTATMATSVSRAGSTNGPLEFLMVARTMETSGPVSIFRKEGAGMEKMEMRPKVISLQKTGPVGQPDAPLFLRETKRRRSSGVDFLGGAPLFLRAREGLCWAGFHVGAPRSASLGSWLQFTSPALLDKIIDFYRTGDRTNQSNRMAFENEIRR